MAGDGLTPTPATPTTGRRRVVLFPFPFGSHITQMLQLGELLLLHTRGTNNNNLRITVLHTDFNAPNPSACHHRDLTFVSIGESLPAAVTADPDMVAQMLALNAACEAPFQAALAEQLLLPNEHVACVVVDGQWHRMLGAAARLGVPALVLRADGANTFLSMLHTPRLLAHGFLPAKEERLEEEVPGLEPLRVGDLIRMDGSSDDTVLRFITANAEAVRASSAGVVLNTFDGIECAELAKIRRELSPRPAFAVGPLHLHLQHALASSSSSPATAAAERGQFQDAPDRSCLAWLDARPPRSVLYVSMGSVARLDRAVFEETAWALAASGVPFLWVLRPGSVAVDLHATAAAAAAEEAPPPPSEVVQLLLPEEVREAARRRGKVVGWAPQREVLAHRAVGGFWTHGGWNSVLEAVCEGVPMLVQPRFGEQIVNARYVTRQWGIGYEVGRPELERTAAAEAIRRLMMDGDEAGAGMRERARVLMKQARECVGEGGEARLALDALVEYICSL